MLNNISFNYQADQIVSIQDLPEDVLMTSFFARLGHQELSCSICLVSKRWNVIASHDSLWRSFVVALEIPADQVNQGKNKQVIIEKIMQLKLLVKEVDPLLDQDVISNMQFELWKMQAYGSCTISVSKKEEELQWIDQKVKESKESCKKKQKGFNSHLLLRRIGLSNIGSLEKYAKHFNKKYELDAGWQSLASEFIRENQLEKVKEILKEQLSRGKESYYLILREVVCSFCVNNQPDEALQFLEREFAFFSLPTNLLNLFIAKGMIDYGENVVNAFLKDIQEKKRFDICENILTKSTIAGLVYSKKGQRDHILNLIEVLLENKQENKAKELIEKYAKEWEKDLKAEDKGSLLAYSYRMIPIYVRTRNNRQAWRLAFEDKSVDKHSLRYLHQVFLAAELFDEAKEVEERLDPKET